MEDQLMVLMLRLSVAPNSLPLFTTVLQSGIEIKTAEGEAAGQFLSKFPGFTAEYLADTVQTIFLNGTALDDLTTPLTGDNPVLALSAAMPGLAGAIFRRNSFHAALRTETKALHSATGKNESITVTLKLFNSIARERGREMLEQGVSIKTHFLSTFLTKRPALLPQIVHIQSDEKEIQYEEMMNLFTEHPMINLNIVAADG